MAERATSTVSSAEIRTFNETAATSLRRQLSPCLAADRWVEAILAGRPYPDFASLANTAERGAAALNDAETLAAIKDHPRIGMLADAASPSAAWSAAEQSGVDTSDGALTEALRAANTDYERRFGHIYLVCATGKDGSEILADLRERLHNAPEAELRTVREQLGEIAKLRLRKVIEG